MVSRATDTAVRASISTPVWPVHSAVARHITLWPDCVDLKFHRHPRQRDRVTQGNEVAGFLGGLDAGDAGDAEHVAFLGGALLDQRQRGGQHGDAAFGNRHSVGARFRRHVDHVGLALRVEVGQGAVWGGLGVGVGRGGHGSAFRRLDSRWVKPWGEGGIIR